MSIAYDAWEVDLQSLTTRAVFFVTPVFAIGFSIASKAGVDRLGNSVKNEGKNHSENT